MASGGSRSQSIPLGASGGNTAKKRASHSLVSRILSGLGYSLQANRKTDEGAKDNPDRNAQFEFINKHAKEYQEKGWPVLSVDTKKKKISATLKKAGENTTKRRA